jgi:hypothetical protein
VVVAVVVVAAVVVAAAVVAAAVLQPRQHQLLVGAAVQKTWLRDLAAYLQPAGLRSLPAFVPVPVSTADLDDWPDLADMLAVLALFPA